jgi:hypothetical protein
MTDDKARIGVAAAVDFAELNAMYGELKQHLEEMRWRLLRGEIGPFKYGLVTLKRQTKEMSRITCNLEFHLEHEIREISAEADKSLRSVK